MIDGIFGSGYQIFGRNLWGNYVVVKGALNTTRGREKEREREREREKYIMTHGILSKT